MDPATRGSVLWWGRFDPDYSRNRILRQLLRELGFGIVDFHPRARVTGALEATLRRPPHPALVWVPCFRQRDLAAARRWAAARALPLVADPLISAYDKQVNERARLAPRSRRARRLLRWEGLRLRAADLVLADTTAHADYFRDTFGLAPERLHVVQLGAEESLFTPAPLPPAPSPSASPAAARADPPPPARRGQFRWRPPLPAHMRTGVPALPGSAFSSR